MCENKDTDTTSVILNFGLHAADMIQKQSCFSLVAYVLSSKWHWRPCHVKLVQILVLGNLIDPSLIGFNHFHRKFPLLYDGCCPCYEMDILSHRAFLHIDFPLAASNKWGETFLWLWSVSVVLVVLWLLSSSEVTRKSPFYVFPELWPAGCV